MRILWRRSPLLLFRFPALAVAVMLVAAIAAITAVAGPLFLASTETGSLREGVDQATRWTAGYSAVFPTSITSFRRPVNEQDVREYLDSMGELETVIAERWDSIPNIDGPYTGAVGEGFDLQTDEGEVRGRLVFREQALDNIEIVDAASTDGLYIPDVTAEALGVTAGDEVDIEASNGTATTPVAGVYRYLTTQPPTSYWSPYSPLIYRQPGSEVDPPVLALVNRATYEELLFEIRDLGAVVFHAPLASEELTIDEAQETVRAFAAESDALPEERFSSFREATPQTALQGIVRTAGERIETVTPVVDMLSGAAAIIALAVAAAAGFYLVKRRRVEVRTLAARGIGPLAQGLRYGIESIVPAVAGTGLGVLIGFLLVSWLGPAESLALGEISDAAARIAVTAVATIAMVTITACLAVWREEVAIAAIPAGVHRHRSTLLALIGALAIGAIAYRMRGQTSAQDVTDARLTIAPVLMLGAGGIVAAVLLLTALPALASKLRYRIPSLYLAARRLSGASGMTRVLVVAGAWALGIAVYGFTASSSVEMTATAKSKIFIGSDYSVLIAIAPDLSPLEASATHVTRIDRLTLANGVEVAALAVDPETFASAAYWDPSFSSSSLDELIEDLDGGGDKMPILSTADLGNNLALKDGFDEVPLELVGTARSFPGMPSDRPLIVMTRDDLSERLGGLGSSARDDEIWLKDVADPEQALRTAGIGYGRFLSSERVLETPGLTALQWLLGLLAALGATAALISVAGLLLYLQARQRTALVSSALTRRMGLSGRREFASWLGEIAGALLLAFVVALAVGLPVSLMMLDRLDPRPNLFPSPIFVTPQLMLAALGLALVLLSLLSAWRVKRSADTADVAQVMRV